MRNLLFINYSVPPERLRALVPDELELDLSTDAEGREVAFVSAVAFHVAELRSSLLPLLRPSFDQVNYRTYVNAGEGPAVYFFNMSVNSRMVLAGTIMLGMPVSYEEIEITSEPHSTVAESELRVVRCAVNSKGLAAAIEIGARHASIGPENAAIPPDFITDRPVGYVKSAADGIMKLLVEHSKLEALAAHVKSARAPMLESLGILNMDESMRPHSALYVGESVFKINPPSPWLPEE